MFYVITLPLLSLFPMTAKENRTKYLFFPPRRKFLSTAMERKKLRGGKNKYSHDKKLAFERKKDRNA